MRFWIFSDLHLDVNGSFPLQLPEPFPEHDAVIIAGDVCEGMARAVSWIDSVGLNKKPVIYVGGNHEFYHHDRYAELAAARETARGFSNIHVLERDALVLDGVTILGCTLWTDYELFGKRAPCMAMAERAVTDHRLIGHGTGKFSPTSALKEHVESRAWLTKRLAGVVHRDGTIVVSHHAPSPQSSSAKYRDHPITAAFASDLQPLLAQAGLWVHGHTHKAVDYEQGGCRVINNPRGYVRHEFTGFQPDLVVTV